MRKTYDLIAIGEILMDMTPVTVNERIAYLANPGGAPCNVLAMASKMGIDTGFVGKVGGDSFGSALREALSSEKIDTTFLMVDSVKPTTLAFVHLDVHGERTFSFYRTACADSAIFYGDISLDNFDYKSIYFGSVGLSMSPLRETIVRLIEESHTKGKVVYYDPNYRPLLWDSEPEAIRWMLIGMKCADVVKVSDEEIMLLTQGNDWRERLDDIHGLGPKIVFLTLGKEGCIISYNGEKRKIPSIVIDKVIDTTGAGDAFFGTAIAMLSQFDKALNDVTIEDVELAARMGNIAAGLCVKGYGAMPSYPNKKEVEEVAFA